MKNVKKDLVSKALNNFVNYSEDMKEVCKYLDLDLIMSNWQELHEEISLDETLLNKLENNVFDTECLNKTHEIFDKEISKNYVEDDMNGVYLRNKTIDYISDLLKSNNINYTIVDSSTISMDSDNYELKIYLEENPYLYVSSNKKKPLENEHPSFGFKFECEKAMLDFVKNTLSK